LRSIPFEKLSVPLSEIGEGISHFAFHVVDFDLEINEGRSFAKDLEVNAQFTVIGDEYLVKAEVKGEGIFSCDRCGESISRSIQGVVQTLYTFDRFKYGEANSDDVHLLSGSEQEIDIRQDVRDALILAVPTKILCQKECLGLCPRCGANLNKKKCKCSNKETDPRWDALKGIHFEE
jgi:uncharacterized protein